MIGFKARRDNSDNAIEAVVVPMLLVDQSPKPSLDSTEELVAAFIRFMEAAAF